MYLGAAEKLSGPVGKGFSGRASAKWDNFPVSFLAHHHEACCELAIEWLRSIDFGQLNGAALLSGPRWLREKYEWGPSPWPLHWCEAVEREVLDCGAHAALAQQLFEARGVVNFRAQFVQRYNREATEQWGKIWDCDDASSHWLSGDLIYHEANALVVTEDSLKLWDGSASSWVKPVQTGGYGGLVSLRIFSDDRWDGPGIMRWGDHHIALNEWNELLAA